ncbi:hypothetical protein QR680_011575 [Steinernema hermaphroditum]|uniref:AB hydrolase-1 domain-containing protein n=1 Tax=Steinernema hermaphroditum TaxID=289476 RepID=A0AA39I1D8_9BILA|nr:hypothetical protein QR680_011575 [Steinernema hermaphroditum]
MGRFLYRHISDHDSDRQPFNERVPLLEADSPQSGTSTAINPFVANADFRLTTSFSPNANAPTIEVSSSQKAIMREQSTQRTKTSSISTALMQSLTNNTESSLNGPHFGVVEMTAQESPSLEAEITQQVSHHCTGADCKHCEALQRGLHQLEQLRRMDQTLLGDASQMSAKLDTTSVQLFVGTDEQKAKRHSRDCQRHNRFERRRRRRYRSESRHRREEDKKFLSLIEKYKQERLQTDCVCDQTRWTKCQECCYDFRTVLHFALRAVFIICPPLPHCFLNKIMFFPPRREYFFFESDEPFRKGGAEAAHKAKLKIRKGELEYTKGQTYRFGFEHRCSPEIENVECFFVRTARKNTIACVFVRSPYPNPRYTIIYAHPNASDISDHLSACPSLSEAARFHNCDVISFDYSGYGISSGRPTETNVYADSEAVLRHLAIDRKIPIANIILYGYSIGTAAMIELSLKYPQIAGLVLLASPASIIRALGWNRGCCCIRNLCQNPDDCYCDRFKSIRKIEHVTAPTLFIHGINDTLVPMEHSQALLKRAQNAVTPLFVPGVGHNNLENSKLVWARVRVFINREARQPIPVPAQPPPRANSNDAKRRNKTRNSDD